MYVVSRHFNSKKNDGTWQTSILFHQVGHPHTSIEKTLWDEKWRPLKIKDKNSNTDISYSFLYSQIRMRKIVGVLTMLAYMHCSACGDWVVFERDSVSDTRLCTTWLVGIYWFFIYFGKTLDWTWYPHSRWLFGQWKYIFFLFLS